VVIIFGEKQISLGPLPWYKKLPASMLAGAGGSMVGSPADVVLVRMQADGKAPPELRYNYKNAFDGLFKMAQKEGILSWWRGCGPNVFRAALMSAGQLAAYDQCKQLLLTTPYFKDNTMTHFTASTMAALVATILCNPSDVVKTRIMNQKKGQKDGVVYKNSIDCAMTIFKTEGPMGFYKGFMPFFARLAPQTILTFIFFEQLAKVFQVVFNNK